MPIVKHLIYSKTQSTRQLPELDPNYSSMDKRWFLSPILSPVDLNPFFNGKNLSFKVEDHKIKTLSRKLVCRAFCYDFVKMMEKVYMEDEGMKLLM